MTLEKWVKKWLVTYKKIMVKPSTYDSYLTYATHVDCEVELAELRQEDVQVLINNMVEDGLKLSTVKHMLTIVRQSLKKAKKLGYVSSLAMLEELELPPDDAAEVKPFRADQVERIMCSDGSFYCDVYKALMLTGLRVGELIALRWCDVDWFTREIHIRNTDYRGELQRVKTKHGRRSLPLYGELLRIFRRRYKARCSDRVFTNTLGLPIKYRTLLDNWRWFSAQIGVYGSYGFHVFRHTFAHMSLRRGVPVKVVSAWLGHADVTITLRIYDSVDSEDFRNAAELLEGILSVRAQKNNALSGVV